LSIKDEKERKQKALWGLFGSLIRNMITGVTVGFTKQLEINGIGFNAAVNGKNLLLNVGFSHPVNFAIPEGIEIKVEKNLISVSGRDKQLVGEISAQIRKIKKPEPYKGKGIKYLNEHIIRKAGKTAAAKS
ncbi:MAG: 50S ribosomal protein L6, partial [Patescibacteria group bacterium]